MAPAGTLQQDVPSSPCTCGRYIGTFCSDRASDADNGNALLTGNCETDVLYHCSQMFGKPEIKAYCSDCNREDKPGTDLCPLQL